MQKITHRAEPIWYHGRRRLRIVHRLRLTQKQNDCMARWDSIHHNAHEAACHVEGVGSMTQVGCTPTFKTSRMTERYCHSSVDAQRILTIRAWVKTILSSAALLKTPYRVRALSVRLPKDNDRSIAMAASPSTSCSQYPIGCRRSSPFSSDDKRSTICWHDNRKTYYN